MIMEGDFVEPLNLGSNELVTINQLVDHRGGNRRRETQAALQSLRAQRREWPQQRQHADQKVFGWEPSTRLRDGLERTYRWIYDLFTHGIKSTSLGVKSAPGPLFCRVFSLFIFFFFLPPVLIRFAGVG